MAKKSLEEVNLLFTSDSVLVSKNMAAYRARIEDANGDVALAARRLFDEADRLEHDEAGESGEDKKDLDTFAVTAEKVETSSDRLELK